MISPNISCYRVGEDFFWFRTSVVGSLQVLGLRCLGTLMG